MKKVLLVPMVFLMTSQTIMAESWNGADKGKHLGVSAVISTVVTGLARNQGYSKTESFFWGAGTALVIGGLKELSDGKGHGNRSAKDFGADALGGLAGALISAQFEWKF